MVDVHYVYNPITFLGHKYKLIAKLIDEGYKYSETKLVHYTVGYYKGKIH